MDKTVNDNLLVNGMPSVITATSRDDKEYTSTVPSLYALQVALQTMKERCQQLQQRLLSVEDENLKLRIEKQGLSIDIPDESKKEISVLHEQIAQLTRQKSQLTQHICMVATENKRLWSRLSRLTEENLSLGSQLTKISDTLNKHSLLGLGESAKPNESFLVMNVDGKPVTTAESNEESLEEISLKINCSIIRDKMELEQQCNQMSAMQSGTLSIEDCEFTLASDGGELEELTQDVCKVLDGLRKQKESLQKQQTSLRATLIILTSLVKGEIKCMNCRKGGTSAPGDSELRTEINNIKDINGRSDPSDIEDNCSNQGNEFDVAESCICPICSQSFQQTANLEEYHFKEEFNSHVNAHFGI